MKAWEQIETSGLCLDSTHDFSGFEPRRDPVTCIGYTVLARPSERSAVRITGAHPKRGGGRWAAAHQIGIKKKKEDKFLDTMILNVLRGLSLSRNQSLKSADDWYIRILKNETKNSMSWMKLREKKKEEF